MGKATILAGGSPDLGYYKIRLEIDRAQADAQILKATKHMETLDVDIIPDLSSARMDARNDWAHGRFVLDEIIKQYHVGGADTPTENLEVATKEERALRDTYIEAKAKYNAAVFKRESLRRKAAYLENHLLGDERYAWCADCTRHLQGEVGTIEIPGTTDEVLIRPGGADGVNAYYDSTRDGQLTHVAAMSTAGAMYAFVMFPGWQKWRPTYRIGTILSIFGDGKYAFVELDKYYSDAQGLDINVESAYAKAFLRYKRQEKPGGDNGVYRAGRRVVLEYKNQDYKETPEVIGFEARPCVPGPVVPPGLFLWRNDGYLYHYAGLTKTIHSIENPPTISGIGIYTWGAACNGPDGIIAAETTLTKKLYQMLGNTTVIDSEIGDITRNIWHLWYDPATGNLLTCHWNAWDPILQPPPLYPNDSFFVHMRDGISPTVLNTMGPLYQADSKEAYVRIRTAMMHEGDLCITVHWPSKAYDPSWLTVNLRMDGFSSTVKEVLGPVQKSLHAVPHAVSHINSDAIIITNLTRGNEVCKFNGKLVKYSELDWCEESWPPSSVPDTFFSGIGYHE